MSTSQNIPDGFINRKEASALLGISPTTFDRLAPYDFKHSRIKVGVGNSYYYREAEIQTYRDFREKRKRSGEEELTWKNLVAENQELITKNMELKQSINVLRWVLWPEFSTGMECKASAEFLEKQDPEKYELAKQILQKYDFDIEELRARLASTIQRKKRQRNRNKRHENQ